MRKDFTTRPDTYIGIIKAYKQMWFFGYTQYIFPHFQLFSDEERLKHLQHIRDGLFNDTERESKSTSTLSEAVNRRSIAIQFITALKALPCLMHDGTLKPISDFSDPDVEIFPTF